MAASVTLRTLIAARIVALPNTHTAAAKPSTRNCVTVCKGDPATASLHCSYGFGSDGVLTSIPVPLLLYDAAGIISRASDVRTDLPLTRMSAENRTLAHVMVDMMVRGGGSLAPHAALRPATRQQARAGMRLARSNAMNGHILFRLAEGYTGASYRARHTPSGAFAVSSL